MILAGHCTRLFTRLRRLEAGHPDQNERGAAKKHRIGDHHSEEREALACAVLHAGTPPLVDRVLDKDG